MSSQPYEDEFHHIYGDSENQSLSVTIVKEVVEYEDSDPMEVEFRLCDVIDPSALNTLFQFNQAAVVTVSFAVSDSHVFLRDIGDGVGIWVSDLPYG